VSSNQQHASHPSAVTNPTQYLRSSQIARPFRWSANAAVLLAALALSWPLQHAGGDLWIADHLYRWQGGHWALRDSWLLSSVLHTGGRWFSVICWVAVVFAWATSSHRNSSIRRREALGYLAVAVLASTLLVTLIKRVSGVDCPWDLQPFGGSHTYLAPFSISEASRSGTCFPAGHASAGYAWLAAGFALAGKPRLRRLAWGLAATAGLVFGIAQQLRGAHFLSHDIWTAALCWVVASSLAAMWCLPDNDAPNPAPDCPRTAGEIAR